MIKRSGRPMDIPNMRTMFLNVKVRCGSSLNRVKQERKQLPGDDILELPANPKEAPDV